MLACQLNPARLIDSYSYVAMKSNTMPCELCDTLRKVSV